MQRALGAGLFESRGRTAVPAQSVDEAIHHVHGAAEHKAHRSQAGKATWRRKHAISPRKTHGCAANDFSVTRKVATRGRSMLPACTRARDRWPSPWGEWLLEVNARRCSGRGSSQAEVLEARRPTRRRANEPARAGRASRPRGPGQGRRRWHGRAPLAGGEGNCVTWPERQRPKRARGSESEDHRGRDHLR